MAVYVAPPTANERLEALDEHYKIFLKEYDAFRSGKKVSGPRARKMLQNIGKLTKIIREDIMEKMHSRKAAIVKPKVIFEDDEVVPVAQPIKVEEVEVQESLDFGLGFPVISSKAENPIEEEVVVEEPVDDGVVDALQETLNLETPEEKV